MFFLYNLIMPIIALLCLPFVLIAFILQPKFRAGFWEKIGFYKKLDTNNETIVFHAVSVGEVNAISSLVKKTRQKFPHLSIVLTTTTRTGQDVANKTLSEYVDKITYFPYDFCFSIQSFLSIYKPTKVIIAETEIWPGFISISELNNVDVYIVNGRISPNSYKGYKKFKFFFKQILAKYKLILMQSESDNERIIDIGSNFEKTKVMGNLKYDIEPALTSEQVTELANSFNLNNKKLFIAASTHAGEDEIVLDVFRRVKNVNPELKLLLAPRHPQRYVQVESLINSYGFNCGKRSKSSGFDNYDVIMLDTMGELSKLFSISHVAFIGGSFSNTGGHNPLEASIFSKPVISGPTIFNFKDVYKLLMEGEAATIVNSVDEFSHKLIALLENNDEYNKASSDAINVFDKNRGAIEFVLTSIF